MTDEAKALVERMGLTLGEWLVDEAPNDWWEYQRDHMKARDLIEEQDRHLTLSGKVSKALSERIEALETQLESANEALRERLDICETQAREIERLREALKRWQYSGCPDCSGDCGSANPPVMCCIMEETRAALGDSHDQ